MDDKKLQKPVVSMTDAEDLVRLVVERDFGQKLNKATVREIAKKVSKAIPRVKVPA